MKLDEKNIQDILQNTNFKELQDKIKHVDIDVDPKALQKLFQSFDPNKLQKAIDLMNSSEVKSSINKISMKNVEGFSNRSYKEGMVNYNALEKIIKNYDRFKAVTEKSENVYTDATTLNDAIERTRSNIVDISSNIDYINGKINSDSNIKNTLNKVKKFLEDETKNMTRNFTKNKQKRDINKRISEFYDRDMSLKKDLLVYLKYLYTFFFVFFILVVFYKKRYKEKKIYIAIALLFLIPNFLIKILYNSLIDVIGHTKLDLLYTFMIVTITAIVVGLFLLMKYVLKPGKEIDLINIGKISKSLTDNIKNKTLNFSKKENETNNTVKSEMKSEIKSEEKKM